jgi:hypothetical protein
MWIQTMPMLTAAWGNPWTIARFTARAPRTQAGQVGETMASKRSLLRFSFR